jgi:hypothetical protein
MDTVTRSGAEYFDVHTGFWINWAHGKVKGSTVTLSRANGGILVAFIAIFVATAGKSFWRILCLFFHCKFTKATPQDAIYHQRQAVLRNSETATFAFWQLIFMLTTWRRRNVQHLTRRVLPMAILAITVAAGFSVASIFSSQITTNTANEVLLTGKNCRIIEVPSELEGAERLDAVMLFNTELSQRIQANLQYSQQCYTGAENDEDCLQYVKSRLPLKVTSDAPCPFSEEICKTKSNIIVDTGFLNSNTDLGINLPKKDQFEVRVLNHCAPLVSQGYSEIYNDTDRYPTAQMRYYYGQFFNNNFTYQSPIYGLSEGLEANDDPMFGHERSEFTIGYALYVIIKSPLANDLPAWQQNTAGSAQIGSSILSHHSINLMPIWVLFSFPLVESNTWILSTTLGFLLLAMVRIPPNLRTTQKPLFQGLR